MTKLDPEERRTGISRSLTVLDNFKTEGDKVELSLFAKRQLEKQRSREEDARALASGEKTAEQLRRENGHFSFPNARISVRGSKPLR